MQGRYMEGALKDTHTHTHIQVHKQALMFMQHYEYIYAGLCTRAHTHVRTAALLQSSRCCLLTAFVLFFLPLSNLSSPAKKCFLPPCGSVHTDTTFQLSEERQTENWVDKSEELLTVKCFARRFCSFSFCSSPHFLTFSSSCIIFTDPSVCHITQPVVTWLLFPLPASLKERGT